MRWLLFLFLIPVWGFSNQGLPTSYSFLKHREHNGVGYDTGYTSIDVMANPIDFSHFYPFLSARGHVFNDGRFASNVGLAGRYLFQKQNWILGANIFYDYRSAKIFSAQQLGAGAEFFFGDIALRANGYLPVGVVKKKDGSHAQVALANLQGEIETVIFTMKHFSLYGALGVYYLSGRAFDNKTFGKAWGSQLRLTGTVYRWVEAGIEATYDHIFNFTFQGYLALKIPLGNTRLHLEENSFIENLFQPIRRNEIIPLQKERR